MQLKEGKRLLRNGLATALMSIGCAIWRFFIGSAIAFLEAAPRAAAGHRVDVNDSL